MAQVQAKDWGYGAGVFEPYWPGLVEVAEHCPAWEQVKAYCDVLNKDVVVQWEGGVDVFGTDVGTEYDWCGYVWHADGTAEELDAADGELWWCLDDLVWGALEDSVLARVDEHGVLHTVEELQDRMRLQGWRFAGDVAAPELPADALDLLQELGGYEYGPGVGPIERAPRRPREGE